MRIAITRFPYESQLGGEELHTLAVAEHWRDQGHQIELYTSCPVLSSLFKENDFEVELFELAKPPVTKMELLMFTLKYPLLLVRAWRLLKMMRKEKTNLIYMLSFTEKLLLPWFWRGRFWFVEHARIGAWFNKNPWRALYYFFARKGKIVTVSEMMSRELGTKDIEVISNGIELEPFAEADTDGSKPPLITTIGRLTEDKGMLDFVDFLKRVKDDWQAVIVGTGPQEEEICALIEEYRLGERIELKANLSRAEIASLLGRTDLFCLLSTEADPFGLVVAEAMAAGAATIATNVCGITEYSPLIETVPVGNAQAVVDAYEQIKERNLEREVYKAEAKAKFSQERMFKEYDALLQ